MSVKVVRRYQKGNGNQYAIVAIVDSERSEDLCAIKRIDVLTRRHGETSSMSNQEANEVAYGFYERLLRGFG